MVPLIVIVAGGVPSAAAGGIPPPAAAPMAMSTAITRGTQLSRWGERVRYASAIISRLLGGVGIVVRLGWETSASRCKRAFVFVTYTPLHRSRLTAVNVAGCAGRAVARWRAVPVAGIA